VQYKNILAIIFNEIKYHVNTSLGLVGGCTPCIPPVSAPVFYAMTLSPHKRQFHDFWISSHKRLFHNFWISPNKRLFHKFWI